ncbi:hypothetical protein [Iamia sp.]|uniref:hypothetical protein n=1 Tax=Iamia sp. TaxID=2722710 RepID=UPI002C173939|nr:hypothetical protein [Iamia sp.]HXH59272.1 hypothetical protein [Iamia sp.]
MARRRPPEDLHEYVSFDDPDEDRTWVYDITFLTSPWTCIFGRGCPGVLDAPAPEMVQGCCSYGAHFTGAEDRAHVEAMAERMTDDQWQFKKVARKRGGPIKVTKAGETVSRLVDDACIFLNRPGFANGPGCSLHQAALEAGDRFMDWKPEVCWQVPLRRVDETDPYGHVTSTLREWKRRDWGEGGHEFHWWCTADDGAFEGHQPVYAEMRDEIIEMTGRVPFGMFVDYVEARSASTFLPHPVLRRR